MINNKKRNQFVKATIIGAWIMAFLLIFDYFVIPAFALQYDCQISEGIADCDIPLEPYWEKIVDNWEKIRQVYQNVKADISVGATEYEVGDNATVFAKVTEDGEAVTDGFCDGLIFYPNQSEYTGFSLSYINSSRGIYSAIVTVPDEIGVYPVDIRCYSPYNATYEDRYFNRESDSDRLKNSTNTINATLTIENQGVGDIACHVMRFQEYTSDRDIEWTDYGYIGTITNITGFWTQSAGTDNWELLYNFYKITDKGTVFLGTTTTGLVTLSITPTQFNYSDITIDYPFGSDSLLQVELCYRKITGGIRDLIFHYNSSTYDSGFIINTVSVEQPLDFMVGGASELNVKDTIFTLLESGRIINERIIGLEKIENDNFCISNTTLRHNITYEYCRGNNCRIISDVMDETCTYGCDSERDKCNEAPFIRNAIIFTLIIIIIIVMIILGVRFK